MPDFTVIDFLAFRPSEMAHRDSARAANRDVILDMCDEAFLHKNWPEFERWFKAYRTLQSSECGKSRDRR